MLKPFFWNMESRDKGLNAILRIMLLVSVKVGLTFLKHHEATLNCKQTYAANYDMQDPRNLTLGYLLCYFKVILLFYWNQSTLSYFTCQLSRAVSKGRWLSGRCTRKIGMSGLSFIDISVLYYTVDNDRRLVLFVY